MKAVISDTKVSLQLAFAFIQISCSSSKGKELPFTPSRNTHHGERERSDNIKAIKTTLFKCFAGKRKCFHLRESAVAAQIFQRQRIASDTKTEFVFFFWSSKSSGNLSFLLAGGKTNALWCVWYHWRFLIFSNWSHNQNLNFISYSGSASGF